MAKWTVVTLAAVSFNAWAQDFSTSGGSVSSGSTTFSHEVRISGLSADFSFVNIEPDKGSSQDITMTKASTIGPDIAMKFSLDDHFLIESINKLNTIDKNEIKHF